MVDVPIVPLAFCEWGSVPELRGPAARTHEACLCRTAGHSGDADGTDAVPQNRRGRPRTDGRCAHHTQHSDMPSGWMC